MKVHQTIVSTNKCETHSQWCVITFASHVCTSDSDCTDSATNSQINWTTEQLFSRLLPSLLGDPLNAGRAVLVIRKCLIILRLFMSIDFQTVNLIATHNQFDVQSNHQAELLKVRDFRGIQGEWYQEIWTTLTILFKL